MIPITCHACQSPVVAPSSRRGFLINAIARLGAANLDLVRRRAMLKAALSMNPDRKTLESAIEAGREIEEAISSNNVAIEDMREELAAVQTGIQVTLAARVTDPYVLAVVLAAEELVRHTDRAPTTEAERLLWAALDQLVGVVEPPALAPAPTP